MGSLFRIYRLLNLASVDVSAGAMIGAAFFGKVIEIKISPNVILALGLTVWIIYTTDHLLDSKKIKTIASTYRHRFFQQYQKIFKILLIIVVLSDFLIVFNLPAPLQMGGLYLTLPVIIYLLIQRYLSPLKELCGAVLYTIGIMLPAITLRNAEFNMSHIALAVQFLFVAWMNLLLFSFFDKERDELDNHISFSTQFGESKTRVLIIVIFVGIFGLTLYQVYSKDWLPGMILLIKSVILLLMLINKSKFDKDERFRLMGDAVFFLPLLYLL